VVDERLYMKIKSLEVIGLFGKPDPIFLEFNDDLNIFSGMNGAGKTTLLKLMWFMISGNTDKALSEIVFSKATIVTTLYEFSVVVDYSNEEKPISTSINLNGDLKDFKIDESFLSIFNNYKKKDEIEWTLTRFIGSSFFLPTFRRLEGGFTTEENSLIPKFINEQSIFFHLNKEDEKNNDINLALNNLSKKLSKKDHHFISSLSSSDVQKLLITKYAQKLEVENLYQDQELILLNEKLDLVNEIMESLKNNGTITDPNRLLSVDNKLKEINTKKMEANKPLISFNETLKHFLPQYKVEINSNLTFVGAEQVINSSYLSAGEKQVLSFIGYNALFNNTIFFIDEPELSLHVDWQNTLFSILNEQNPSNQFIISTHSPFIYSLFPDKEFIIDDDKGCSIEGFN
jgi:ABC-type lipoprotein export system ATPase subunit